MLILLHIENYALIRQADISFDGGFTAITGETGAGKSIMLGALGLLLGQRADSSVLSDPERKCVVEALFDIRGLQLQSLFADNDVDYAEDGQLIIRREILPSAKSRAFVNDTPVSVAFLKELGSRLIDIHSQHETLLLADSAFRLRILDCLAHSAPALDDYQNAYRRYSTLKHRLEQLTAEEARNRKDLDYNRFLFEELEQAALRDGEQEDLEEESRLLANAETIKEALSQAVGVCDGEEDSALQRLNYAKSLLSKTTQYHSDLGSLNDRLESALIELRDIVDTLEGLNDGIVYSPERQEQVDGRLDLIYRLEKKHGVDNIADLRAIQEELDRQIAHVDSADQEIQAVMEAVDAAYADLQRNADKLSSMRAAAAAELGKQMSPLLADLGMAQASLTAGVERCDTFGPMGNDRVSLLFNANKGGTPHDLSKVASGGEMSRLMLAIKALTASAALLPTVIFDEIDSGISGDISLKVGRIMQRMAQTMQVVAITHLPQIAARAQQHFKVYKAIEDNATTSHLRLLDTEDRRRELAVMLSSDPPTAAALQTATELMAND